MVRELWAHRELIAQLTRREITQRYRGILSGCARCLFRKSDASSPLTTVTAVLGVLGYA